MNYPGPLTSRASSSSLIVGRTRLSTVGDRAFPVVAARIWNSLPRHVTSAPSLLVFRSRLKTHLLTYFLLFPSQSATMYSARAVTTVESRRIGGVNRIRNYSVRLPTDSVDNLEAEHFIDIDAFFSTMTSLRRHLSPTSIAQQHRKL